MLTDWLHACLISRTLAKDKGLKIKGLQKLAICKKQLQSKMTIQELAPIATGKR